MIKYIPLHLFYWSIIIGLFGCNETDSISVQSSDDNNPETATIVTKTINHNQHVREYHLYIPSSYKSAVNSCLLMNFHGFGGDALYHMQYADMKDIADENNIILVYPQGTPDSKGSPHWNPCPNGGDNKSNADDLGFVESMLNAISSEYSIDQERIFAIGYSNGGMMAYGLANYKSDLIAGVGSVSGTMLDCIGTTSHPMPVLHLHGTLDGDIPYEGNNYYNSVQSTLDHWINFNQTTTEPIITSENQGSISIEHSVYDKGTNGVAIEHYKYIGGSHVWFDTEFDSQTTSQLIWNFFSRYDLNGLR